jgi:hypothetical protein
LRTISAVAAAALLGGCGSIDRHQAGMSDWERANYARFARERTDPMPQLPPYPKQADLVKFWEHPTSNFKFYIDQSSIAVDKRGVVHYVMVAKSSEGAENVTYEAMNCRAKEYRMFATGHANGTWLARAGDWRVIQPRTTQRWHNELFYFFFCPNMRPIEDAEEGRQALALGKHPWLHRVENPFLGGASD